MKIKIGKFVITADERQFIVNQVYTPRNGDSAGKEIFINQTFHSNLESAFENILKREVLDSKVESIKELLTFIKKQKADLKKMFDLSINKT